MIIVPLFGGLGNQLFQYAFLRASSISLDRRPVLDATALPSGKGRHRRSFELHYVKGPKDLRFLGSMSDKSPELVRAFASFSGRKLACALARRTLFEDSGRDTLVDFHQIPAAVARCYGYWQSHLYFTSIADEIRAELTPSVDSEGRVSHILNSVAGRETIAVHVRRGDYAEVGRIRAVHGVVNARYYKAGVDRAAGSMSESPLVLVLSDDPEWAIRNLSFDVETLHVERTAPLLPTESLALMSRTHHHVISNSTFSWWGAWLAEHPDQRVFYPQRWFAERAVDPAFRFPANWNAL